MKQSNFVRAAQPSMYVTFLKRFAHLLENVWGSTDCNELNELSAFVSMRLGCSGLGIRSALCFEACLSQSTDPNICSIVATSVSLASTCTALCWVPIHKPHTNISTCLEPNSSQYMKSFHHNFQPIGKNSLRTYFWRLKIAFLCVCARMCEVSKNRNEKGRSEGICR